MKTLNKSCHFCDQRLNTSIILNVAFCEHCKVYHSYFQGNLTLLAFYFDQELNPTDDSQAGYNLLISIKPNTFSLELKDKVIMENIPNANHISPNNAKDVVQRLSKLTVFS